MLHYSSQCSCHPRNAWSWEEKLGAKVLQNRECFAALQLLLLWSATYSEHNRNSRGALGLDMRFLTQSYPAQNVFIAVCHARGFSRVSGRAARFVTCNFSECTARSTPGRGLVPISWRNCRADAVHGSNGRPGESRVELCCCVPRLQMQKKSPTETLESSMWQYQQHGHGKCCATEFII